MANLQNQIALVTGATSGIGQVTATELAKLGAHVVILGRNAERAAATQREIKAAAGHERIDVLLADLADLDQVRRAAAEFNARYPRLDILVNNAGLILGAQRQVSPQGYELGVATTSGVYFDKKRAEPVKNSFNTPEHARQLWKLSEQLTGTQFLA